ncbi:hypothetical protein [Mesorhizobium sp. Z1-4]|uniref:hypothetical protein n=1 Tax=Mesorhizobium sp. Z1-4 TaxID=2448478 RepID=UPI001FE0E822|nr:hypothetical protein [Mesorhizobium sp. Z1-4]
MSARRLSVGSACLAALMISGCQSGPVADAGVSVPGDNSALSTMERIAVASQKCWFKPQKEGFEGLALSPELTSFSGRPRILAVPRGNVGGLPKLVIEAAGKPARISAYGPLMDGPQGPSIAADAQRWASGDTSCSAAA